MPVKKFRKFLAYKLAKKALLFTFISYLGFDILSKNFSDEALAFIYTIRFVIQWILNTAARMCCGVTNVKHLPQNYTVTSVIITFVRNVWENTSWTNQKNTT